MGRQLEVILQSSDDESAFISLPSLLRTLGAVQNIALQIGEMLEGHALVPARGEFAGPIRAACEFKVCSLTAGSPACAVLELPPLPAQQPLLVEDGDEGDLGERALERLLKISNEIANGAAWPVIADVLPAQYHRRKVLDTYRRLCPTPAEHQWVSLGPPGLARTAPKIGPEHRKVVQILAAKDTVTDVIEERQLIGRLNMVQGVPPQLEISQGRRGFACAYDQEELGEQLGGMWNKLVIATGVCRVIPHDDEDDEIVELRGIADINLVPTEPLLITEVVSEGVSRPLREPIEVAPDFSDNLVSFDYSPLGIVAYGETREEAEAAFREELSWCWGFYALADDSTLSRGAQQLKASLLLLVRGGGG